MQCYFPKDSISKIPRVMQRTQQVKHVLALMDPGRSLTVHITACLVPPYHTPPHP